MKRIIGVDEKVSPKMLIPLSIQHTFAMFGASVLVPIVLGINPSIVLLMNGIGTLLFILITKRKAPAYLGSSFAFLGPATIIIGQSGFRYAQGAFVAIGLIGCILAYIIYKFGTDWIDVVLPPAAMGSVVSLIGFELAQATVSGGKIGANIMTDTRTTNDLIVFLVTLSVAILGSVLFKKFLATIPILIAIITGYIVSVALKMVDFTPVMQASLFTLPKFQLPIFDLKSIITMLPVILVITSEHISHQVVTSNIIGRDLLKEPGLHRSIFADNFSTAISGFIGGVPTTTYGENIGVMAIRWSNILTLRHDRNKWYQIISRPKSRLLTIQKLNINFCNICNWTFRIENKLLGSVIIRNGSSISCCSSVELIILCI